jgi:hypothetical protein
MLTDALSEPDARAKEASVKAASTASALAIVARRAEPAVMATP